LLADLVQRLARFHQQLRGGHAVVSRCSCGITGERAIRRRRAGAKAAEAACARLAAEAM